MANQNKEFKLLISLILIVVAFCYASSFAADFPRTYLLTPKTAELLFLRPWWHFLCNDLWPKGRFVFIVRNKESKDGMNIDSGVLIVEITEDKGLGVEPDEKEFKFFSYAMFNVIKPGKQATLTFTISEKYKPGRFRVKPTLFIYPKDKSPIHSLYKTMNDHGSDVLNAWESVYFSDWRENLGEVPGVLIFKRGSDLVTTHSFLEVWGVVTGVTGISILGIVYCIYKRIHAKKNQLKQQANEIEIEPKIYLSRATKGRYSLGEIYNSGNEDIVDFKVMMKYTDKTGRSLTKETMFINESENPLLAPYHTCRILRQNERKFITDFPNVEVLVEIRGKGAKSNIILKEDIVV